jgi:hypothetical protein
MATSRAATAEAYLAELPEARRAVVAAVRETILRNLPDGYEESMAWGMLSYGIPLTRYPDTYNRQPLVYVGLAAHKNAYSLYLTCVYVDAAQEQRLRDGFAAAGRKLDMGKSCLRFKRLEDLPLEVIGESVASTPPERLISLHEASRAGGR